MSKMKARGMGVLLLLCFCAGGYGYSQPSYRPLPIGDSLTPSDTNISWNVIFWSKLGAYAGDSNLAAPNGLWYPPQHPDPIGWLWRYDIRGDTIISGKLYRKVYRVCTRTLRIRREWWQSIKKYLYLPGECDSYPCTPPLSQFSGVCEGQVFTSCVPGFHLGYNAIPRLIGFIRQDSVERRVYFMERGDTAEDVLYDFSIEPQGTYDTLSGFFKKQILHQVHIIKQWMNTIPQLSPSFIIYGCDSSLNPITETTFPDSADIDVILMQDTFFTAGYGHIPGKGWIDTVRAGMCNFLGRPMFSTSWCSSPDTIHAELVFFKLKNGSRFPSKGYYTAFIEGIGSRNGLFETRPGTFYNFFQTYFPKDSLTNPPATYKTPIFYQPPADTPAYLDTIPFPCPVSLSYVGTHYRGDSFSQSISPLPPHSWNDCPSCFGTPLPIKVYYEFSPSLHTGGTGGMWLNGNTPYTSIPFPGPLDTGAICGFQASYYECTYQSGVSLNPFFVLPPPCISMPYYPDSCGFTWLPSFRPVSMGCYDGCSGYWVYWGTHWIFNPLCYTYDDQPYSDLYCDLIQGIGERSASIEEINGYIKDKTLVLFCSRCSGNSISIILSSVAGSIIFSTSVGNCSYPVMIKMDREIPPGSYMVTIKKEGTIIGRGKIVNVE